MKLSVVIPTHNRPSYLERALKSLHNSSGLEIEVIVVNDGSNVDYSEIINKYKILVTKYITILSRSGVSHARNTGVRHASGDWILFLDDDDEIADGYIADLMACLVEVDPSVGFIWGNVDIYQYNNDLVTISERRYSYASPKELEFEASKIGASFGLAIKREVLDSVGLFDCSFSVGEDTELIIRIMSQGVGLLHLDVLATRKHDHNDRRLTTDLAKYSNDKIYETIIDRHEQYIRSNDFILDNVIKWCFYVHLMSGNFRSALDVVFRGRSYAISLSEFAMYFISNCYRNIWK